MLKFFCTWAHIRSSVNFINILRVAFTRANPKSAKKTVKSSSFFALLGSACVKAACRTLMKCSPNLHFLLLQNPYQRTLFVQCCVVVNTTAATYTDGFLRPHHIFYELAAAVVVIAVVVVVASFSCCMCLNIVHSRLSVWMRVGACKNRRLGNLYRNLSSDLTDFNLNGYRLIKSKQNIKQRTIFFF